MKGLNYKEPAFRGMLCNLSIHQAVEMVFMVFSILDDSSNPELAEQGKDITIDNLLR